MSSKLTPAQPIKEDLRLLGDCPLCRTKYLEEKKIVLIKKEGSRLLHLTCEKCQHAVLVLEVVSPFGMSSVGMVTDLKVEDARRLYQREAINEDELIDFHQLINSFEKFTPSNPPAGGCAGQVKSL